MSQHLKILAAAGARLLGRAGRDERGVVAIWFGLVLAFMIPLIMIGINLHMASGQRMKFQDALDAATLAAARTDYTDKDELTEVGRKALLANLAGAGMSVEAADLANIEFWADGQTVKSSGTLRYDALGAANLGFNSVGASSDVMRSVDKLEIVLVLDNTGSMQSSQKLATLKTAATELLKKLQAAGARSTEPDAIKVGIVPFSMTVRVAPSTSLSGYDVAAHSGGDVPSWMDGRARARWATLADHPEIFDVQRDRFELMKRMGVSWSGCVESRFPPYDISDAAPDPNDPKTLFVPYFWPDERDGTSYNNYLKDQVSSDGKSNQMELKYSAKYFASQVDSRGRTIKDAYGNPLNVVPKSGDFSLDSSSYGGPYTYGPNAGCVHAPITRLTILRTEQDLTPLNSTVTAMKAVGETNIAMGLIWGWHVLSPNTPFADGRAYGEEHSRKIVILMTDGDNTMNNPGGTEDSGSYYGGLGYVWQNHYKGSTTTNATGMNNRLKALCTAMKKNEQPGDPNITIYAVRLAVTSSDTTLQNCATPGAEYYYDVKTVSGLQAAFNAIAGSIDNLRISR